MGRSQVTVRIARPAEVVFDAIERHAWMNDPAWEAEVVEIRPVDPWPIALGSRAVMVRTDFGKTRETTFVITALDAPRRLALRHLDGPLDFALSFDIAAVGAEAADVTVTVVMRARGPMRLLTPLFALMGPRTNRRLSEQMARAIEASTTPANSPVSVPGAASAT